MDALDIRLLGLFVIMVVSVLGVLIPLMFNSEDRPKLFLVFSAAATGVILGICFIHILPEALKNLEVAFEGKDYPFGFFIIMCTILCTFILETELSILFCRLTGQRHHHHHGKLHMEAPDSPCDVALAIGHSHAPGHGHGHGRSHSISSSQPTSPPTSLPEKHDSSSSLNDAHPCNGQLTSAPTSSSQSPLPNLPRGKKHAILPLAVPITTTSSATTSTSHSSDDLHAHDAHKEHGDHAHDDHDDHGEHAHHYHDDHSHEHIPHEEDGPAVHGKSSITGRHHHGSNTSCFSTMGAAALVDVGAHKAMQSEKSEVGHGEMGAFEKALSSEEVGKSYKMPTKLELRQYEIESARRQRQFIMTHALELGIALHSVIIGLAFGATTEMNVLKSLVVALSFHQLLEGFGLGAAIVEGNITGRHRWILVFFFSITTPAGIAVGIAISTSYDEENVHQAMTQGLLESIAGGVLIYLSLVDLMANMFREEQAPGCFRLLPYCAMVGGAAIMCIIGLWA
eukprot:gb/GEZN01004387.1/.p1 GENE.gb/GEZN01004387.1/~~gb/GEZN01004387.1/.p1  ORF type:complete len:510 (-),score=70.03 gb/GEZN01004387.1/:221-1750(-)